MPKEGLLVVNGYVGCVCMLMVSMCLAVDTHLLLIHSGLRRRHYLMHAQ